MFAWTSPFGRALKIIACVLVLLLIGPSLVGTRLHAVDDDVVLDKRVVVVVTMRDKTRFRARVVAYNERSVELAEDDKPSRKHGWSYIELSSVYQIYEAAMPGKTGKNYMAMGNLLASLEGGQTLAMRAYRSALRVDPGMEKQVEAALEALKSNQPAGEKPPVTGKGADKNAAPKSDAKTDKIWDLMTGEVLTAAIEEMREFSKELVKRGGQELKLTETDYFLFYTDLDDEEVKNWTRQLDAMYYKCCEMFGIDKGINIWNGKAAVFVFKQQRSFMEFEVRNFGSASSNVLGLCHPYRDGSIVITFYRQPNDVEFAALLVHEATHGFVHRYRANRSIPSWLNEGLAEFVADDLVPTNTKLILAREGYAKAQMDTTKSMGGNFFQSRGGIAGWQYGVASLFTKYLVKTNKRGYVALLNAYKDGKTDKEAFQAAFGKSMEDVVDAFGKDIRVRDLKP